MAECRADGQRLFTLSGARLENLKDRFGKVTNTVLRGGELRITETATGKEIASGLTLPDGVQEANSAPVAAGFSPRTGSVRPDSGT